MTPESIKRHSFSFWRWTLIGIVLGALCGVAGTAFHKGAAVADSWFALHPWLLYLLPIGGIIIVMLYRGTKQSAMLGTDVLFHSVSEGKAVPLVLSPLIFIATCITHLLGGSAGREGAALQIGGGIAEIIAKIFHADENLRRTMVVAGMGALFAALFGTPVAAMVFVLEIFCMGSLLYSAILPTGVACCTAYCVSQLLGSEAEGYHITAMAVTPITMLQVLALAIIAAGASILFCEVMHTVPKYAKKWFPNEYVRVCIGGVLIIGLTLLVGVRDYNGGGDILIRRAIEEGTARPWDFLLKLLFTSITLGFCFKGGEIVPAFAFGAALGCIIGPVIGMDASFAAAICLVAVFSGNTNCPIAAILLSVELFNGTSIPLFALAAVITYILSGNFSLYHAQGIAYKDFKLGEMLSTKQD